MSENSSIRQRHALARVRYAPRMIETIHLQLLLATFAAWSNRRQARLITDLIEENRVVSE